MSKLRIFAALLALFTGCSTAPRHRADLNYSETPLAQAKNSVETEHITDSPAIAPPPGPDLVTTHVLTNHFVNTWLPMKAWCNENKAGTLQRISSGLVPTFALKAASGLLIFSAYDLVAYWNSMELHLGFAPQVLNGQPTVSSLDLAKNIGPLLHPLTLPDRTNRVIVIDPGHGGSNLGTKSVLNGAYEKEYTLDWAKRLMPILATNGWKVFLTRTTDTDLSLTDRVAFADACKADLFVSLHFNAAPSPTDHDEAGIETFCVTPAGMPSTLTREFDDDSSLVFPNNRFDFENLQYAIQVHRSLLKISGARDHGVRRARFMTVLRGQNRPAILIEGGYLSNTREAKRVAEPAYRQKLAEAVAAALVEKSTPPTQPIAVDLKTTSTNSVPTP